MAKDAHQAKKDSWPRFYGCVRGRKAYRLTPYIPILAMSQHPSFRLTAGSGKKRNVLKRFERIELMKKRGVWKDGTRVVGLPKTRVEV